MPAVLTAQIAWQGLVFSTSLPEPRDLAMAPETSAISLGLQVPITNSQSFQRRALKSRSGAALHYSLAESADFEPESE